jgi:hypothetical protein
MHAQRYPVGFTGYIAVYGPDNHMRLTGKHETQSIHQFSYGVADRGASIRVPHLPDRVPDPEDDRLGPDRLRGERRRLSAADRDPIRRSEHAAVDRWTYFGVRRNRPPELLWF